MDRITTEGHHLYPLGQWYYLIWTRVWISNYIHFIHCDALNHSTHTNHRDGMWCSISFSLILDSSVGWSVGIQSAGDLVSETLGSNPAFSRGRQLVSFRFESRLLCPSIDIDNNKHVYRQSQVQKPTGNGVEWAEYSLIIGTGCRVSVFSLIIDSSMGLSAVIQSAGDLVSKTLGSNPAFSRGKHLVSFRFQYRFPVLEHRN